ncbi:MAG: hypothetical protein AAGI28_08895 [Pseudomonadota bacterium]
MLIETVLAASLVLAVQDAPTVEPAAPPAPEPVQEASKVSSSDTRVAATEEPAVSDDDKVICRRTAVTGSRFKKRICATRKEWESLRVRSRDAAQEMQNRGRGAALPNGGR